MSRGTPREVVLEEVQFMLAAGESPVRIAATLGIQPGSVAKSLWRSGRPDLAVKFENNRGAESYGCVDCGAPISRNGRRCRPCGFVERSRRLFEGAEHCPREGCKRHLDDDGRCRSHGAPKRVAA